MDISRIPCFSMNWRRLVLATVFSTLILSGVWPIEKNLSISAGTSYPAGEETVIEAATETITTESGVVVADGADVLFVAGERVVLNPGFTVETGAKFTAAVGQMGDRLLNTEEDWSGTKYLGNSLTVESGGDLHIDGNCTLVFFPGASIFVEGELVIEAGAVLTSLIADEFWNGITVTSGSVMIEDCRIENALHGLQVYGTTDYVQVQGTTFYNNYIGVHALGHGTFPPTIANCLFDSNIWYGIKEDETGNPVVTDTVFSG